MYYYVTRVTKYYYRIQTLMQQLINAAIIDTQGNRQSIKRLN